MEIRVTFHSLIVLKFSTVARMYVTTLSGVPRSMIMTVIHGERVPRITVSGVSVLVSWIDIILDLWECIMKFFLF